MNPDDLIHWLKLIRVPGMQAELLALLRAHFGSVDRIATASEADLAAAGLAPQAAQQLARSDAAQLDVDLRWTTGNGHLLITLDSPYYPDLLKQLRGAPIALFMRGQVATLSTPQLAIVGARNPTRLGRETAEAFAQHLAACGLTITSGLAVGIDGAAHRGALKGNGLTVAVCATGLDTIYPREHRELAESICDALVSEFPPNTPPLKFHFPRRNRLISGLSLGTLVVEAAIHSGSLITAKFAADQGREVFAIPGSIHNPLARGCHQLLKNGAKLVESADDVLAELGPLAATLRDRRPAPAANPKEESAPPLDKDYKMLLDALGFEPTTVDQLVARTGF